MSMSNLILDDAQKDCAHQGNSKSDARFSIVCIDPAEPA